MVNMKMKPSLPGGAVSSGMRENAKGVPTKTHAAIDCMEVPVDNPQNFSVLDHPYGKR